MKVIIAGRPVEYRDEGSGKVVVLLHGWGTSLATFDLLAAHLKTRFRVIRFDFPGFGGSVKPGDEATVSDYAQITSLLLDKLKTGKPYAVIGHSFGGRVIIKGVADKVLAAEKVVLIGAAGVKPTKSMKKTALMALAKTGKALTAFPGAGKLRSSLRKKLYSAAGSTDYLEAQAMQRIFLNTINEDLLPYVSAITQPALLIWGENDTETPVADARRMMARLANAKLVVVPHAGHFTYTDDTPAVLKELDAFL